MISAPILKGLTCYLSSLDGISAVYDKNFELHWTNCEVFFKELDVSEIKADRPDKETHYKVKYQGETALMTAAPIYKYNSVRTVDAYTVTVKTTYQVFKMISRTSAADHVNMFLKENGTRIAELTQLNEKMSENGMTNELLNSQSRTLSAMETDIMNYSESLFPKKNTSNVNCNVSRLLLAICEDAAECLKGVKRKFTAETTERNCYRMIDHKLLTAGVAHILNCHLNLSPLKSGINVQVFCGKDGVFRAVIKSKSDREGLTDWDRLGCELSRNIAEKIIKDDCGGEFNFMDNGKTVTSEFILSVMLKNKRATLNARNAPYTVPGCKPVRHLLKKTMEAEIVKLEEIKMEAAKKKKLNNIN